MSEKMTPEQDEVKQVLRNINDAWIKGDPNDIANYLHEEMVITGPDFIKLGKGKDECVDSYKKFKGMATILDVKETELMVDVFGDTAVATYSFEITHEIDEKTSTHRGRDMFTFTRIENKWLAVWRTIFPLGR